MIESMQQNANDNEHMYDSINVNMDELDVSYNPDKVYNDTAQTLKDRCC